MGTMSGQRELRGIEGLDLHNCELETGGRKTDGMICITIKDKYIDEEPDADTIVDEGLIDLLKNKLPTSLMNVGTYQGMSETTSFYLSVKKLSRLYFDRLLEFKDKLYIDWLNDYRLYYLTTEVEDLPDESILSNDGLEALISLRLSNWSEIKNITNKLFWGKNLSAKLMTENYVLIEE